MNSDEGPKKLILKTLKKYSEGLTISDIAKVTKMNRLTISKYVYGLVSEGTVLERKIGSAKLCYLKKINGKTIKIVPILVSTLFLLSFGIFLVPVLAAEGGCTASVGGVGYCHCCNVNQMNVTVYPPSGTSKSGPYTMTYSSSSGTCSSDNITNTSTYNLGYTFCPEEGQYNASINVSEAGGDENCGTYNLNTSSNMTLTGYNVNYDTDSNWCGCKAGSGKYNSSAMSWEAGTPNCCGDDTNENKVSRSCASGCGSNSADWACCDAATDCVYSATCYANGYSGDIDSDNVPENCTSGAWITGNTTIPPAYSLNGTNSTVAGSAVKHSLYWTDNIDLSGYIFSFYNGTNNGTSWWDSSWLYRMPINISVTTGNKTNPQINITVNTSGLVSQGKLNASCSDVRFTWLNSTSGLEQNISFWNETACNSATTKYWMLVPFLQNASNGNNTIYMYYDYPAASAFTGWVPSNATSNYTTAGTFNWTAPAGVTWVKAEVWAGGGGGGGSVTEMKGGGGGGGGAYSRNSSVAVTPGTTYTNAVVVGAGGAGSLYSDGSSGGTSSFISESICHAHGGTGGVGYEGGGGGGAGGNANNGIGDAKYSGGNGGDSAFIGTGGGGGGAGNQSNGGNGSLNTGGSGGNYGGGAGGEADGSQPGGGGGGGFGQIYSGGNGATGMVTLTYINSTNVSLAFLSEQTPLINDTWVSMTGTGNWSNVTKTVTSTVGATIKWCVYANDTSNNWNSSSCSSPFSYVTTDATPPTFSSYSANTTGAGKPVNFSINVTDNVNLNSSAGYIFSTNNSGTWTNSSYAAFAGSGLTLTAWNVTTLNSTLGAVVQWRFYANDTSNNWNSSAIYNLTTTDVTPPTFSANATSTRRAGNSTNFTITVTDNVNLGSTAGYIFSTNNSGAWTNSSYAAFAGSGSTLTAWNVTTLNSTVGALVQWRFYANDTSNNWNSSAIYNLTTIIVTQPLVTINLNATEVWWGDPVNISIQASRNNNPITNGNVNVSLNTLTGGLVCSQSSATDANGRYSCIFAAPKSIGTYNVSVDVYDPSSEETYSNSTTIKVKIAFGESETEKAGAPSVGCYKVPRIVQNPDGSIQKVMVTICTLK